MQLLQANSEYVIVPRCVFVCILKGGIRCCSCPPRTELKDVNYSSKMEFVGKGEDILLVIENRS